MLFVIMLSSKVAIILQQKQDCSTLRRCGSRLAHRVPSGKGFCDFDELISTVIGISEKSPIIDGTLLKEGLFRMITMTNLGFVPNLSLSKSFFGEQQTLCQQKRGAFASGKCRKERVDPRIRKVVRCGVEESFENIANKLAQEMGMDTERTDEKDKKEGSSSASKVDNKAGSKVEVGDGRGGMTRVKLTHGSSNQTAEVYQYGAAVTSWTTRGNEVFWLSDQNRWEMGGKAIRGGVPICWPQFGPYGQLPQHGFARISKWDIVEHGVKDDGSAQATFLLTNEMEGEGSQWGPKFETTLTVILSSMGLETKLAVKNTGNEPMEFTAAFHNYLKVYEVADVRLFGLEGLKYKNRTQNDALVEPQGEMDPSGLEIKSETDRIYIDAPEELAMFEFSQLKVTKIKKTPTLPDATIWNPFGEKGCDPGWNNFVCIEPAAINNPVTPPAGEEWVGSQLLGIE